MKACDLRSQYWKHSRMPPPPPWEMPTLDGGVLRWSGRGVFSFVIQNSSGDARDLVKGRTLELVSRWENGMVQGQTLHCVWVPPHQHTSRPSRLTPTHKIAAVIPKIATYTAQIPKLSHTPCGGASWAPSGAQREFSATKTQCSRCEDNTGRALDKRSRSGVFVVPGRS